MSYFSLDICWFSELWTEFETDSLNNLEREGREPIVVTILLHLRCVDNRFALLLLPFGRASPSPVSPFSLHFAKAAVGNAIPCDALLFQQSLSLSPSLSLPLSLSLALSLSLSLPSLRLSLSLSQQIGIEDEGKK